MLYLNAVSTVQGGLKQPNLTLTSVVFEYYKALVCLSCFNHLTLTSVVFELNPPKPIEQMSSYLTLTSVVFEF